MAQICQIIITWCPNSSTRCVFCYPECVFCICKRTISTIRTTIPMFRIKYITILFTTPSGRHRVNLCIIIIPTTWCIRICYRSTTVVTHILHMIFWRSPNCCTMCIPRYLKSITRYYIIRQSSTTPFKRKITLITNCRIINTHITTQRVYIITSSVRIFNIYRITITIILHTISNNPIITTIISNIIKWRTNSITSYNVGSWCIFST